MTKDVEACLDNNEFKKITQINKQQNINKQKDTKYTVYLKSLVSYIRKHTKQKIQKIFFIALQNSRHRLQHTFDNIHTASINNQQRPPVESISERLPHDL